MKSVVNWSDEIILFYLKMFVLGAAAMAVGTVIYQRKACQGYIRSFKTDTVDQILPGLYLTSGGKAADRNVIDQYAITGIVNVTNQPMGDPNYFDGELPYHNIAIPDNGEPIITEYLPEYVNFVSTHLASGNVLVHCWAGISRSATFVIAYLMVRENMSFDNAFQLVKSKREKINPKPGFIKQLQALEQPRTE